MLEYLHQQKYLSLMDVIVSLPHKEYCLLIGTQCGLLPASVLPEQLSLLI